MNENLRAALKALGLEGSDLSSPAVQAVINGGQKWLGGSINRQDAARLSRREALDLLNDSRAMAKLGEDRFGFERLQAWLGLQAYAYVGGFWNYYPTSHQNAFKFPPLILSSYPLRWRLRYWMNNWALIDPATTKAVWERQPTLWRCRDFVGLAEPLGRFAMNEGIFEGVTIPVFRQGSEFATCTFAPSPSGLVTTDELWENRHGLKLFCEVFHDMAFGPERHKAQARIHLTKRERQVLSMIVDGYKNTKIASVLQVTDSAVQKHQESICNKFQVPSRNDLTGEAIAFGFTTLGGSQTPVQQQQ